MYGYVIKQVQYAGVSSRQESNQSVDEHIRKRMQRGYGVVLSSEGKY